ncbi:MAG: CobQ/CobB/MinD/ParA nucleotide binding domain protein [bacterium ADurb.Bin157]|nr:MAG: CobQ/CobB/MinD/ParA nucleotide binding domain protein [bacterium ADurb.Bin157]
MILNVAHQKGGVGKSTIAINLAVSLKADILDLDNQHSCILFNKIRKANGLDPLNCFSCDEESEIDLILKQYLNSKTLIIDSGGFDSKNNRLALIKSNLIITPVSPSQIELFGLQKFERILKEASEILKINIKTNVVINNADARSKGITKTVREYIEENPAYLNLFKTVIHNRADFKKAYASGLGATELGRKGKAADEVQQLTKEIISVCNIQV